jgi:sigma-B regulation protein RsbU (phosphoserine phosphatase)
MSNVQATTRAFMTPGAAPEEAAAAINRALCHHAALGRFVTLFVSIYDLRTRTLRFCNAGHNPPIVVRADGRVVRLSAGGLVAGAFDTARYEGGAIGLEPGDRVCLFTDGLPEATSPSGGEFGDERLVDVVAAARGQDAAAMIEALFREVRAVVCGPCQDDATAVILGVR